MSVPEALESLIYVNTSYNIICCKNADCLHALSPKTAALHFQKKHHLSLGLRKDLEAFLTTLDNLASEKLQRQPPHGSDPQPHLRIASGLFQCHRCLVVKSNKQNMRQHVNSAHGIKNFVTEAECSTVSGQTWFQGNKAIWWQVVAPAPEVALPHTDTPAGPRPASLQDKLVEELLRGEKEQLQEEERQRWQLQAQHNPDQVSPWLQTTGWLQVFANTEASFADLAKLVQTPSVEELHLQLLAELLTDYVIPRCLDTLRNTPHPYRTWLKSPQEEVDQPKPFMEPQNDSTLKKYTRYWVQYICFIIRSYAAFLADSDLEDNSSLDVVAPYESEAGLYLTSQQHFCLRQIHRLLLQAPNQSMEELEDGVCQQLASRVFQFCLLSVRQQLHLESPYKSSLVYFLAHMGIDAAKNAFREPQTYTSILAGVLYVSRLFVLEHSLSASGWAILNIEAHESQKTIDHELVTEETPLEESTMKAFQAERKNWLVQGKNTPIAALLRLLAYGKMVNRMQGRPPAVIWNQSLTSLYFREHPVDIARFKAAVHHIAADANQCLQKLLLGQNREIDLDKIQDSISCDGLWGRTGHNFTCHPANNLAKGLEDMLYCAAGQRGGRHLLEEEGRSIEITEEPSEQDGQERRDRLEREDGHQETHQRLLKWKSKPCKDYLQLEREFLDLLLITVHLTGGQPARGPEICSFKHSNGQTSSRNVYVLNGQVAIITQYDKARAIRGKTNYIARYLPAQVSKMLVQYMVWVRPFAIAMERQVAPNFNVQRDGSTASRSEYLWIGSKDPSSDQYVNRLFKRTMQQYLGLMLNISDYRHIAIAIAREFLQPHCAVLGINEETSINSNGNGEELAADDEEDNLILDLQAAHTTRTAELAYAADARFLNKLSGRLLQQFLHASTAWHDWLHCRSEPAPSLQAAKRGRSDTSARELPASATAKRQAQFKLAMHGSMPSIAAGHDSKELQTALQKLYGPQAQFRCKAQAISVEFLVSCSKSTASIHILGTGQGKSLFFFLLASLAQMQTVLVVVPYVALIQDLVRRAQALGLRAAQWTSEKETAEASLVFVSADLVLLPVFIHYAHVLAANGQLKHIFLDECHVALTDTSYRQNLQYLGNLRLIDAPLACLTATLPPALEERLQQQLFLGKTTVFRNSTAQKNIQYRIVYCQKQDLLPHVVQHVRCSNLNRKAQELGIVFVRSIIMGERLAKELNCPLYHSHAEDKERKLDSWKADKQQWIVATGALGTGLDITGIREVVHMDRPYGMISYVQQAGRGGRNGFASVATLYVNIASLKPRKSDAQLSAYSVEQIDEEALTNYMTSTGCRRESIAQYMDGARSSNSHANSCIAKSMLPCDECQKQLDKQHDSGAATKEVDSTPISSDNSDNESNIGSTGISLARNRSLEESSEEEEKEVEVDAACTGSEIVAQTMRQQVQKQTLRLKAIREARSCCLYCRMRLDKIDASHKYMKCPHANKSAESSESWQNYKRWRDLIYFPNYRACYSCGLNQEECGRDIAGKEDCSKRHVVFEFLFLLTRDDAIMACIKENWFKGSTKQEFGSWLASDCTEEHGISWIVYIFTLCCVSILDDDDWKAIL